MTKIKVLRHFALLGMTRYPPPSPLRKGGGLRGLQLRKGGGTREKILLVLREGEQKAKSSAREWEINPLHTSKTK